MLALRIRMDVLRELCEGQNMLTDAISDISHPRDDIGQIVITELEQTIKQLTLAKEKLERHSR